MVTQSEAGLGAKTTRQIEPNTIYVQFGIQHILVSTVRGRFSDVRGTIVVDQDTPATRWSNW